MSFPLIHFPRPRRRSVTIMVQIPGLDKDGEEPGLRFRDLTHERTAFRKGFRHLDVTMLRRMSGLREAHAGAQRVFAVP